MSNNIIIGVDPGYDRCGIAVLDASCGVGKEVLLFSTCVQTAKHDTFHARLGKIASVFSETVVNFKPNILAIESLFFNNNQKTASRVLEVKGAVEVLAINRNLDIREFTPLQIKSAITGNGRADKKDIYRMLQHLVKINKDIKVDDEFDAIACALTCSASVKFK